VIAEVVGARIVYVASHRRRREGGRAPRDLGVDHLDAISGLGIGHVAVDADVDDDE